MGFSHLLKYWATLPPLTAEITVVSLLIILLAYSYPEHFDKYLNTLKGTYETSHFFHTSGYGESSGTKTDSTCRDSPRLLERESTQIQSIDYNDEIENEITINNLEIRDKNNDTRIIDLDDAIEKKHKDDIFAEGDDDVVLPTKATPLPSVDTSNDNHCSDAVDVVAEVAPMSDGNDHVAPFDDHDSVTDESDAEQTFSGDGVAVRGHRESIGLPSRGLRRTDEITHLSGEPAMQCDAIKSGLTLSEFILNHLRRSLPREAIQQPEVLRPERGYTNEGVRMECFPVTGNESITALLEKEVPVNPTAHHRSLDTLKEGDDFQDIQNISREELNSDFFKDEQITNKIIRKDSLSIRCRKHVVIENIPVSSENIHQGFVKSELKDEDTSKLGYHRYEFPLKTTEECLETKEKPRFKNISTLFDLRSMFWGKVNPERGLSLSDGLFKNMRTTIVGAVKTNTPTNSNPFASGCCGPFEDPNLYEDPENGKSEKLKILHDSFLKTSDEYISSKKPLPHKDINLSKKESIDFSKISSRCRLIFGSTSHQVPSNDKMPITDKQIPTNGNITAHSVEENVKSTKLVFDKDTFLRMNKDKFLRTRKDVQVLKPPVKNNNLLDLSVTSFGDSMNEKYFAGKSGGEKTSNEPHIAQKVSRSESKYTNIPPKSSKITTESSYKLKYRGSPSNRPVNKISPTKTRTIGMETKTPIGPKISKREVTGVKRNNSPTAGGPSGTFDNQEKHNGTFSRIVCTITRKIKGNVKTPRSPSRKNVPSQNKVYVLKGKKQGSNAFLAEDPVVAQLNLRSMDVFHPELESETIHPHSLKSSNTDLNIPSTGSFTRINTNVKRQRF